MSLHKFTIDQNKEDSHIKNKLNSFGSGLKIKSTEKGKMKMISVDPCRLNEMRRFTLIELLVVIAIIAI